MNFLKIDILILLLIQTIWIEGQVNYLPQGMADHEYKLMDSYLESRSQTKGITSPPPFTSLRTAAQWEEVQALVITWTGQYNIIQSQIVDAAQEECMVIIHCSDSSSVKSTLSTNGVPLSNIRFLEVNFNSVWIRDYAANSVYADDVDSLILVDWIYNRPRPDDDIIPDSYAALLGVPLYSMSQSPNDIMATGGNWMSDGFSTSFSSNLILDENDGAGNQSLNYPNHTETEINQLYGDWMGISNYIKMTNLPYDDIHHIDMHMKIEDEETLVIGEFPAGTSDGPQMEANIQYLLSNFTTVWGDPFKIVRVPMPPSTGGSYAPSSSYRTYANHIIINKKILLPTYREQYDTIAIRILQEVHPGHTIVPIDVDNSGQNLIASGGAIHCITHTVGVSDPMWITHKKLADTFDDVTPYQIEAMIKHKSGIASATMYYKTTFVGSYSPVAMSSIGNDIWTADIPSQNVGTSIYYYVEGNSNSGKTLQRPLTAPNGYWKFNVLGSNVGINELGWHAALEDIYPNPATQITVIPINANKETFGSLIMYNMLGEKVKILHEGKFPQYQKNFFIDASNFPAGVYHVVFKSNKNTQSKTLVIQ
jgi:agmatine deiminase